MAMTYATREAAALFIGAICIGVGSSILNPEIVADVASIVITIVCSVFMATVLLPLFRVSVRKR